MIEIIELKKEHYQMILHFSYLTKGHYRVDQEASNGSFGLKFVYEEFDQVMNKSFDDVLVPSYFGKPKAYGAKVDGLIVGYVTVNHEAYSNRCRVAQLLIHDEYRYQGIGKQLMDHAETYAKQLDARAMILETQSCNVSAIRFYQTCGYQLVGCDLTAYSNQDVQNGEVRLEMGKLLKR